MAISTGEGYSLLGQGFAQAAQGNLSEQRKLMKEAQRRQLMTAALTPIAQGVGKFATDLISAPFKDAASNFYNRGAGKGLNANRKAYRSLERQAKDRMAQINKQGKYSYYEPLATQAKEAYENKNLLELGADYKNHTVYRQGLVDLPKLIKEQQDQEYDEALVEYNSYLDSPSKAEVSAAIKKYSPYATNPASWFYKKAKQILLRQDSAELEQKSLDVLQTHLSSYGMDLSADNLAKLKERNRTGSDAYFSADVLKAMPQFQSQDYKNAVNDFKDGDELRAYINREGSGGEQNLLQELQQDNKKLVSSKQFEQGITNKFFELFDSPKVDKARTSFRSNLATTALPDHILKYMNDNNLDPNTDKATKFTNSLADGAWETATLIHNRSLLSDPKAMSELQLNQGDTARYTGNIRRIANFLINEKTKEQSFELGGMYDFFSIGTKKMGMIIDVGEFKSFQEPVINTSTSNPSSISTPTDAPTDIKIALGDKKYAAVNVGLTKDLQNLIGSGRNSTDMQSQLEVILTKLNSGLATSAAASENGRPEDYSVEVLLNPVQQQIVDDIKSGDTRDTVLITDEDRANRNSPENVQKYLEQLRNIPSMQLINPDNPVVQLLNPFSKTTKSPEEMERINSERQQAVTDYENRSSSEAFADVESGRDIVDPKLQVARETYKSNLREPFQNVKSLFDVTPKSPERIEEIRNQRSAAIAEYESNKEPDVASGPSVLDSVIDFLIPKAEASKKLKVETKEEGTSISRAAKRNKTQEMNRWENKDTVTVTAEEIKGLDALNVLFDRGRDLRDLEVPTKNPVEFIKQNMNTTSEAVAVYYKALEKHNAEKPSSSTYHMKPLTQSMIWAYEAFPEEIPRLEGMYKRRIVASDSIKLLNKIESPSNEKEIKTYTTKVSKMTDSQKEKEFVRQYRIAKDINVITDADMIANAVAYRKLQSIYGEENNRVLPNNVEGTTVNDKVDLYYNDLNYSRRPSYMERTKLYKKVLDNIKTPVAFSLLAQR